MIDHVQTLSAAGAARRGRILEAALAAQRRRVRRRQAARAAVGSTAAVLAIASAYFALSPAPTPHSPGRPIAGALPHIPALHAAYHVPTDGALLERVSVPTRSHAGEHAIDDEELGVLLQASGSRPGVIRVGSRALLEQDLLQPASPGT